MLCSRTHTVCYTRRNSLTELGVDMTWWQRLFGGNKQSSAREQYLYVQCQRCQTMLAVRIDLYNDVSAEYDDASGQEHYILRKDIVDARCFQRMHAEIHYDQHRREQKRSLQGGTFLDAATYQQLVADADSR